MHERVIVVTLFVCLSVANLEDGRLLVLQRGMNLNWTTIYIPLIHNSALFLRKVK